MSATRLTLKKISADLGLDPGTVSHILNHDDDRYSAATRGRVIGYARRVGYRSNTLARAMRTKKTGIVGVLFRKEPGHPLANEGFYMRLIEGLESELLDHHYKILLSSVNDSDIAAAKVPDILLDGLVEGLVIIGSRDERWLRAVGKENPNLVLLDQDLEEFHCVIGDYVQSGQIAAEHLLALGHRRIGVITSLEEDPNFSRRIEGFVDVIKARGGCPPVRIFKGDPWGDGGGDVARELQKEGLQGITALFAVNDHLALGAIREFTRAGVGIPAELSIVGCDNLPSGTLIDPNLTTIQIPKRKMGQEGARRLIHLLEVSESSPQTIILSTSLVARESSAEV